MKQRAICVLSSKQERLRQNKGSHQEHTSCLITGMAFGTLSRLLHVASHTEERKIRQGLFYSPCLLRFLTLSSDKNIVVPNCFKNEKIVGNKFVIDNVSLFIESLDFIDLFLLLKKRAQPVAIGTLSRLGTHTHTHTPFVLQEFDAPLAMAAFR